MICGYYSIFYRISSAASIDSAINGSGGSKPHKSSQSKEAHNVKKFKRLQYLQEKLQKLKDGDSNFEKITKEIHKLRSELLVSSCPNPRNGARDPNASPTGTKNEISKLLNFDDDSYSDTEILPSPDNNTKRFKKSKEEELMNTSLNLTSSERLETSFTNCAVWLQKEDGLVERKKTINLPDLSQPPPPLLNSNYGQKGQLVVTPDKKDQWNNEVSSTSDMKLSPKDKERDRSRRGLPNIREKHICSK